MQVWAKLSTKTCLSPSTFKTTTVDGVQSTTVEKVDAGTLDQCQGSSVFPLYAKQQPSERRPCFHI